MFLLMDRCSFDVFFLNILFFSPGVPMFPSWIATFSPERLEIYSQRLEIYSKRLEMHSNDCFLC